MMRSLFSGVAGLRIHQTGMDVIGANISNVNTVGYKGSRSNFSDVISQTMQGAASATGNRGGTNPIQVGLGMGLAMASTLSRFASMCGMQAGIELITIDTCPPTASFSAMAPPL